MPQQIEYVFVCLRGCGQFRLQLYKDNEGMLTCFAESNVYVLCSLCESMAIEGFYGNKIGSYSLLLGYLNPLTWSS